MNRRIIHVSVLALAFLYIIVAYNLGFSNIVEISGVLFVLAIFFGLWFWIPPTHYDGDIVVTSVDGKKIISLELNQDPGEIINMKIVSFKVVIEPEEESQTIHGL
jgi:hypothetical protein